jgi:hypothetical protein
MIKNSLRLFPSAAPLLSSALLLVAFSAAAQAPGKATTRTAQAHAKPMAALPESPTPLNEESIATRANALTANMTQGLGLTPAQVEKVRVINTKSVRGVEAARQRFRQDPAKLRSYIDDIGLGRLDQLKEVLTPAQFTRYQRKREEKMGIPNVQGVQGTPPPGLGSNRGEE